ncbi:MAG TPA: hypothetical protein VKV03_05490 [Candidatus Binataceae bacterium]|nr:hypothetical protein [Candidatus Binataceae bacterium]
MADAWKMPPPIKIYEALGAIGDGRVRLEDEHRALVTSSEGDKTYEVEIAGDARREISSNDNASYWQGYLGYPAVAVLLVRGLYRPPANVIDALAGIPWKEINRRYQNDYDATIAEVNRTVEASGHDPDAVASEVESIIEALRAFRPVRGKRKRPPSESKRPRVKKLSRKS